MLQNRMIKENIFNYVNKYNCLPDASLLHQYDLQAVNQTHETILMQIMQERMKANEKQIEYLIDNTNFSINDHYGDNVVTIYLKNSHRGNYLINENYFSIFVKATINPEVNNRTSVEKTLLILDNCMKFSKNYLSTLCKHVEDVRWLALYIKRNKKKYKFLYKSPEIQLILEKEILNLRLGNTKEDKKPQIVKI